MWWLEDSACLTQGVDLYLFCKTKSDTEILIGQLNTKICGCGFAATKVLFARYSCFRSVITGGVVVRKRIVGTHKNN